MKRLRIIAIIAVTTALWACSNTSKTQYLPLPALDLVPITQSEVKPMQLTSSNTVSTLGGDFDFDVFKALRSRQSICISPFSLGAVLSMAAEGAGGATAEQMWKVLGKDYSAVPESKTVKVANSVWLNKQVSLIQDYKKTVQNKYSSEVYNKDFGQRSFIGDVNRWCSKNTNGKIPSIMDTVDPDMQMLLLNAVYFYDKWESPFTRTDKAPFTCLDGTVQQVDMMHQTARLLYCQNDFFQILELPYESGDIDMYVLLPRPGVAFDDAVASLSTTRWEGWRRELRSERVRVSMPKFKLECEMDFTGLLQDLGMKLAFSNMSDFSLMSTTPLAIGFVKQKTYIDVDEEGTEAAAVTGLGMRTTSVAPSNVIDFTADRPFFYIIRSDSTSDILFLGQVLSL
jgi:serpin B